MDICLNPSFYNFIALIISKGFDSFTINRRTVDAIDDYFEQPELAAAEIGYFHPGFDCFIIRKDFVGVRGVDRSLLFNMVAFSEKCLLIKNVAMTFHLGNDMDWLSREFDEYTGYVRQENKLLLDRLILENYHRMHEFCSNHNESLQV